MTIHHFHPEGLPEAHGLYDPRNEHDACGIGAVVDIKGRKSHQTVSDALTIVEHLEHRAGKDATGKVGDGVGILLQVSHSFFKKATKEAGISVETIRRFAGKIPILGVCLGHQSIGYAFGGDIVRAGRLMHGKTSLIHHEDKGIFNGMPKPFEAIRYHSLVIEPSTLPECLEVTARTDIGEIMGVRHREYIVEGVQFHPESILTQEGKRLLRNFLDMKY